MVYLLKTHINRKQKVSTGLCKIYGLGLKSAEKSCNLAGISCFLKIDSLSNPQLSKLAYIIEKFFIINTERQKFYKIKEERLLKSRCIRGFKFRKKFYRKPIKNLKKSNKRGNKTRSKFNLNKKKI